jgi:hypothetical protein
MKKNGPEVVVFGVDPWGHRGGWIADKYEDIFFLDQGDIAAAMKTRAYPV